jgi:hypothetical protein
MMGDECDGTAEVSSLAPLNIRLPNYYFEVLRSTSYYSRHSHRYNRVYGTVSVRWWGSISENEEQKEFESNLAC